MTICWKYLVPIAFVNLLGTAMWMVFMPQMLADVFRVLLFTRHLRRARHFCMRVYFQCTERAFASGTF
jgi:hypothetical protein